MHFFAYGTYSDNAVTNITSHVTWNSDNSNIAYIDVSGLVTGEAAGRNHQPCGKLAGDNFCRNSCVNDAWAGINFYCHHTTVNTFD
jgi:hypothetical protein